MAKYSGKKILILGTSTSSVDLIEYAHRNGAYVVVADYFPPEKSVAKQHADESLLCSTADLDTLEQFVNENKIDCVYSGISEFNLIQAMRLAERCGLRFYCTEKQWNTIADKEQFRQLCVEHGVPCPKTYYSGLGAPSDYSCIEKYPCIIKPVDASSSAGVHICMNEGELKLYSDDAVSESTCGKIIIEQLVSGYEFTAHYTIYNGKATLSCMDNRYPTAVHDGAVTTIPAARIYPSLFTDELIEKANPSMLRLCESLGLRYGVLFVQGMYDPTTGSFAIFEGGLRSAGECPFRFIEKINGANYSTMILDYLVLGSLPELEWQDDPHFKGLVCGVVSFVAKHGVVGSIVGLEKIVSEQKDIVAFESRYPVGSETPDRDTLHQLMIRFFLIADDRESLMRDVEQINEHVDVFDDKGNCMVLKFDQNRLLSYK